MDKNQRKNRHKIEPDTGSNNIWYIGNLAVPLLRAKFRLHRLHEIFIPRRLIPRFPSRIISRIILSVFISSSTLRTSASFFLLSVFVHNPRAIYTRRAKRGGCRQASFPNYGMRKNYQVGTWLPEGTSRIHNVCKRYTEGKRACLHSL